MIVATSQLRDAVMGLRDAVYVGAKTYPNNVIVSLSIKLPSTGAEVDGCVDHGAEVDGWRRS